MATETKKKKVTPKKKNIAKKAVSISDAKKDKVLSKKTPVKTTTKKVATKKPTTKKPTTKKPTTKKPTTKKPTTKKPTTKKPTTKKPTTKKPTTKKPTTKKPTTKKPTTKKPVATKKVTTKKPTAKKITQKEETLKPVVEPIEKEEQKDEGKVVTKPNKKESPKALAKAKKKQDAKDKAIAKTKAKEDAKAKIAETKAKAIEVKKKVKKEKVVYKLKDIDKPISDITKGPKAMNKTLIKKTQEVEEQVAKKRDKKLIKSLKRLSTLQARLDEIEGNPIMEIRKRHKREKLLENRIELIKKRNAEKHALKDSEKAINITTKKSMNLFMQKGSNKIAMDILLKKGEFDLKLLVRSLQHEIATEKTHKNRNEKQTSFTLSAFQNAEKTKGEQAKMLERNRKVVEAKKIKEDKRLEKIKKRIAKRKDRIDAKDARDKKTFDKQVAIAKKELKRQMELEFSQKNETDSEWKIREIEDLKLQISQVNNAGIESTAAEFENEINEQEEKIIDLNNKIENLDPNNNEQTKEKEALYEELEKTREVVIKLNLEFKKKIADAVSKASVSARRQVNKIKEELLLKAENDSRLQESIAIEEERIRDDELRKAKEDKEERDIEDAMRLKKIENDTLVEEERLRSLSREREKSASDEIDRFNRIKDDLQNKREKAQDDLEAERQIANDELEEAKRNARIKHEEAFGKLEDLSIENKEKELDSTKQIDIFKSKIKKDW